MAKEQQYKYKGGKCTVCGMSVSEMVNRFGTFNRMFELHHIDPGKKANNYNNLIKQKLSAKQLDELDKCILLCRNCHGLVHAQNIDINGEISINYNGHEVSQKITGWLVVDQINNKLQILCEEQLLIEPFTEQISEQSKKLVFGVQLQDGSHLKNQLKSLKLNQSYKVWKAETNELMLRVTRHDETFEIETNIKFPFIEMDGGQQAKGDKFWYRKGIVLYDTGEVQTEGSFTFHLTVDCFP